MYAIFEDGGKQYRVSQGEKLLIERKDLEDAQSEITFDKVLLVGEGEGAQIGTPWLPGASVVAKVIEEMKLPKVVGIKFRRRKGSMTKWGHRQRALLVEISAINA